MKKIKGFIIILTFIFVTTCGYFLINKNNNKIVHDDLLNEIEDFVQQEDQENQFKIVFEEIEPKEFLSLEDELYNSEYERGKKSFYKQMGIILVNKNEKTFDYTVLKEAPEEQKEKYQEITNKAYTEGYHKASESFYCPAGHAH